MTTNAFAAGAYAAIQNMGRAPTSGLTGAGAGEGGFTQLLSSALDGCRKPASAPTARPWRSPPARPTSSTW